MSILHTVLDIMMKAQELSELKTGEEKKRWVMITVRDTLQFSDEIEDLIINFIDIIIEVDKGNIKINNNIKKVFLSPCNYICPNIKKVMNKK